MTHSQANQIVTLIRDMIHNETRDFGQSGYGMNWSAESDLLEILKTIPVESGEVPNE